MRVRDFRIEDYDAVVALWKSAELPFRPYGRDRRETIEAEIRGTSAVFLVAEIGDELVGVVFGTHDGRKGWINRLAVAPERRRQGIASELVREVETRLRATGIRIIGCLIEEENEISKAAFTQLGYVQHDELVYCAKRFDPDV